MVARATWIRLVTYVGGLTLLLLIAQYFLGLWTNVYAPAQFASFDSGAGYSPSLDAHILNGDVLFLLALIVLVFAAVSKRIRLIVPAVVLVIAVFVAGELGMAFVNSTPNDPIDSFGMGTMFLVALFSAAALMMLSANARRVADPTRATVAPQFQPG